MPPLSANKLRARLAAIEAAAPERRRQAERFILAHYRAHRRLPRGPAPFIIPRQRLNKLIFRGELEHMLGLTSVLLRLAELHRCAGGLRGRLRG